MGCRAAPDTLQQVVARQDPAVLASQRVQQTKLGRGQSGVGSVDVRLHLIRVDAQSCHFDHVATGGCGLTRPATCSCLDAGDEFLHGERFDQVVVGPDLQGVYAVMLGAARAHDDDGDADSFAAGRFDQSPSVNAGEHEVQHADVGSFKAQSRKSRLALADPRRVKPGRGKVPGHALPNKLVVFNYEYLAHMTT